MLAKIGRADPAEHGLSKVWQPGVCLSDGVKVADLFAGESAVHILDAEMQELGTGAFARAASVGRIFKLP